MLGSPTCKMSRARESARACIYVCGAPRAASPATRELLYAVPYTQLYKLTGVEGNLADHDPSGGEAEAQLHELADAVVQLYRDVARVLEDFVLRSVVDDRVAGVVLAADAEQNVHLRKDLRTEKTMGMAKQSPLVFLSISFVAGTRSRAHGI